MTRATTTRTTCPLCGDRRCDGDDAHRPGAPFALIALILAALVVAGVWAVTAGLSAGLGLIFGG